MLIDQIEQGLQPLPVGRPHPWYALRVKERHEPSIACSLQNRGYVEFVPLYTCTRKWSDRVRKLELPLFPGYVFCRFDFNDRRPIVTIPGVMGVVGMGKLPHPVEEHEIATLQAVAKSGLLMQPWPFLKLGEHVTIQDGPLRNAEGVVVKLGDGPRLVVSVSLLQRSIAVRLERSWIRPMAA